MRRLATILLLFAATLTTAQTPDSYGGVAAASCANPNGTTYFGIATVQGRKVFCTPSGNAFYSRGPTVFDDPTYLGNDAGGHDYAYYLDQKLGATNRHYKWAEESLQRLRAWRLNTLGVSSNINAFPLAVWPAPWSSTNPYKVPFVAGEDLCMYAMRADTAPRFGLLDQPVHNLGTATSSFYSGYTGDGPADYWDARWTTYGQNAYRTESFMQSLVNAAASDRSYLLGFSFCDSDNTHGFEAGPDYDTAALVDVRLGHKDIRLSYLVLGVSPIQFARANGIIYPDPLVYSKKRLRDQLAAKYTTITALNTAWGSTYTSWDSTGTCVGNLPISCASTVAEEAVGSGDGVTLSFSHILAHTTVSAFSVGIYAGGTLVAGDAGGNLYGTNVSGTVVYSTGVVSLTWTAGHAPSGAITARYVANGWGTGAGFMDEALQHTAWVGLDPYCIDGAGMGCPSDPSCTGLGCVASHASAGVVTDLDQFDYDAAYHFPHEASTTVHTYFPGAVILGPVAWATWAIPPQRAVIQGMIAGGVDVMVTGGGQMTQAALDFVRTHAGKDLPLLDITYIASNKDSQFSWTGAATVRGTGNTATATVSTPHNITTGRLIDVECADSTYNTYQIYPSAVIANDVSFATAVRPRTANTTCAVFFHDPNYAGYQTQAARGNAIAAEMLWDFAAAYTVSGIHPYIGTWIWAWQDNPNEGINWGLVSTKDNAYDGRETTTSTVACSPPLQAYTCGGELRSGWGATDAITPITQAGKAIDLGLLGLGYHVELQNLTVKNVTLK